MTTIESTSFSNVFSAQESNNQYGVKSWLRKKIQQPLVQKIKYIFEAELDKDVAAAADVAGGANKVVNKVIDLIPESPGDSIFIKFAKSLPDGLRQVSKKVIEAGRKVFLSEGVKKFFFYSGLAFGGAAIAFAIHAIYERVIGASAAVKSNDKELFADNVMDMAYNMGSLMSSVTGVVLELASEGIIAVSSLAWLPVVGAVSAVFSAMGVVKNGINMGQSIQKHHQFKVLVSGKDVDKAFEEVLTMLETMKPKHVSKYYGKDQTWLVEKLKEIQTTEEREEALKILQGRIKSTAIHQGLGMGTGVISIVASVTLLIPATVIAAPFLFLTAAVGSVAKDSFSWYKRVRFRVDIENLEKISQEKRSVSSKKAEDVVIQNGMFMINIPKHAIPIPAS